MHLDADEELVGFVGDIQMSRSGVTQSQDSIRHSTVGILLNNQMITIQ